MINLFSFKGAVLQVGGQSNILYSVMFSSADPSVIAVAGLGHRTILYDIRNMKR